MKRFVLALTMLATPALAQEPAWVGIWSADPDWCQYAELIGGHDPAPIRITQTEVAGLENTCKVAGVRGNEQMQYWELTLSCMGEGESYSTTALLMLDDENTLWRWYGGGDPAKYTRCGG